MPVFSAVFCQSRKKLDAGKPSKGFHSASQKFLKRWLVNMKRDKWKSNKESLLCSDNFDEQAFDRTGQTKNQSWCCAHSFKLACSFAEEKLMVLLRDGKTLIGYLRSIDQFANLVLHRTIERIHVGKKYGDINCGVVVVRGENVVLLGEIDVNRETTAGLQEVAVNEILEAQRIDQETRQEQERARSQALKKRGLPFALDTTQEDF